VFIKALLFCEFVLSDLSILLFIAYSSRNLTILPFYYTTIGSEKQSAQSTIMSASFCTQATKHVCPSESPTPLPNNCRAFRRRHTKYASGRQNPRISFGNYEFPIDKAHTFCYNQLVKQKTAYRAPYRRKEKTQ